MPPALPSGADPPVLLLYPFRFVDPLAGRWVRARYRAALQDLAARYDRFEVTGEPEVRHVGVAGFSPWR